MDADKVLVMDAGQVGEFGPVPTLLAREGGLFRGMVASE
jgi:ABC-type multidrug transport system fused ATPase/permease subunit